MATVIDALLVTIGLDTTDYKKNAKDLDEGQKKTRDNLVKYGKDQAENNKKTAESFGLIKKEALGLFSVLIGAGSLAAFTKNTVDSMLNVQAVARGMGVASKQIQAFQAVIQANHGNGPASAQSLFGLSQTMEGWSRGIAPDPQLVGVLQKIGAQRGDDAMTVFQKFADWSAGKDPKDVELRGGQLGLNQDAIQEAMKGGAQYAKEYADALQRVGQDEGAYDNIRRLNSQFQQLGQTLQTDGAIVLNAFAPALTKFLKGFGDSIDQQLRSLMSLGKAWNALTHGDFKGAATFAMDAFKERGNAALYELGVKNSPSNSSDAAATATSPGGSSAPGALFKGGNQSQALYIATRMKAAGISDSTIVGVLKGINSEGGKFGEVDQTDAQGNSAHGIGQWRGPRWAALTARYGPHPSPDQEVDFLISELKGGDKGGPSVLGAGNARDAFMAYITQFMRPGSGTSGDLARGGVYGGSYAGISNRGNTTIHVNKIEVSTKSTDAKGVAREVKAVLNTRALTGMAAQGLV